MKRKNDAYSSVVQRSEIADAVKAYREENADAFNIIYEQSSEYLKKYALYLTKDYSAAEDLLQETYMRIILKINSLKEPATFMS